ncbi:hypothetical protein Tco_0414546 [Tanacetum coccineum]
MDNPADSGGGGGVERCTPHIFEGAVEDRHYISHSWCMVWTNCEFTSSEDELQDKRIRSSAFGESKSHSWTPNRILSCFITTHREVDWIASLLPDQGGERFIGFRVIVELQSYEIVIDEDSCSSPITALIFITTLLLLAALSEAFLEGVAGVDKIKDS